MGNTHISQADIWGELESLLSPYKHCIYLVGRFCEGYIYIVFDFLWIAIYNANGACAFNHNILLNSPTPPPRARGDLALLSKTSTFSVRLMSIHNGFTRIMFPIVQKLLHWVKYWDDMTTCFYGRKQNLTGMSWVFPHTRRVCLFLHDTAKVH